ncbi:hypothetical protein [Streptomyces sp. DH8]|uniref:hypothetical protein n=1 Tax=Streptomyces sp. DH8 TaxID=2857008 RepID=UPI001E63BAEC|nr:hypothetical protein [Streptomyces sp. DH8]
MASYYVSPSGTSVMKSGGLFPPPDDWTEITEEDYYQRLTEAGQNYEQMPVRNLDDVQAEEPPE